MSAWIVTKEHIDLLVAAAKGEDEMDGIEPDALGAMLWAENHKSVNCRYSEATEAPAYKFTPPRGKIDPVVVLKQINCYAYQTCEHKEWEASKAYKFCENLKNAMIHSLPGYEAAPWGIGNR